MSKGKWGESFLKSGLPLEHLTFVTFRSLGWRCETHIEYQRQNREGKKTWFEFDLEATSPESNNDTELSFLVECKYHDLSRFWIFLPFESDSVYLNDSVFNCGPLQVLTDFMSQSALHLAPKSMWGIVVSEDGRKQDNAVHKAVQQLVNGFVPYALFKMFYYNLEVIDDAPPIITALIPMIVTNARIFRLKPESRDLAEIREATSAEEIADEVEWTWCHHDSSMELWLQNVEAIEAHKQSDAELLQRFPLVEQNLVRFSSRPAWIAVANIKFLSNVIDTIFQHFLSLETYSAQKIFQIYADQQGDG
jgi:hypothetical protein